MTRPNIEEAIKNLKIKNSEGFDRIPQRIITDGIKYLTLPLTALFNKIYNQRSKHKQWKMSKIKDQMQRITACMIQIIKDTTQLIKCSSLNL